LGSESIWGGKRTRPEEKMTKPSPSPTTMARNSPTLYAMATSMSRYLLRAQTTDNAGVGGKEGLRIGVCVHSSSHKNCVHKKPTLAARPRELGWTMRRRVGGIGGRGAHPMVKLTVCPAMASRPSWMCSGVNARAGLDAGQNLPAHDTISKCEHEGATTP
jgi:hypothetical protein